MMHRGFTDFAERLREATRTAHRELDHHPLLAPLVRPVLSEHDYAKALAALCGPQQAIEEALEQFAPRELFPPRVNYLENDLRQIGISPYPLMSGLPGCESIACMIGVMYVIEGSNLGGTVIARQLAQSLPPDVPRTFFANTGSLARWQAFWGFAASQIREEDFPLVAEAAIQTFRMYKEHLDR